MNTVYTLYFDDSLGSAELFFWQKVAPLFLHMRRQLHLPAKHSINEGALLREGLPMQQADMTLMKSRLVGASTIRDEGYR